MWTLLQLAESQQVILQVGDNVHEQIAFLAYAAPDEECNNLICALKLITNLMKGNKPGIAARSLEEL